MCEMLFKKFVGFMEREVAAEGETKSSAVLVRYLCLALFIYGLLAGVSQFFIGAAGAGVPHIAFSAGAVIVFLMTYRNAVSHTLTMLCILFAILAVWGTLLYHWDYGYQNFFYIIILILYFNNTISMKCKVIFSLGITVVLVLLALFSFTSKNMRNPGPVIFWLNLMFFVALLLIIGIAYSRKSVESEYKLLQYNKKLQKMAGSDPLTGLMNRRNITDVMYILEKRYKQKQISLSIAIADIDFFKKVNDTYGHDAGDYVLVELAKLLEEFMDDRGYAARWGGEEFLLVFRGLSGVNADDVFRTLDDFRSLLAKHVYVFKETEIRLTMTFGLEEYSISQGIEGTIKNADNKLYLGKEQGRNRVVY